MNTLLRNWKTTLGGLIAAGPQLIGAFGLSSDPRATKWLNIISVLGAAFGLFSAKDYNVHSTAAQVQTATLTDVQQPGASAVTKIETTQVQRPPAIPVAGGTTGGNK